MFELSLPKLVLIALVVLVLFGRGKVADLMGEFGKGVKNFKEGMGEGEKSSAPPSQITTTTTVSPPTVSPAASGATLEQAPKQD